MIYDYAIQTLGAPFTEIYGRLIPNNAFGPYLMALALIPALIFCAVRERLTETRQHQFVVATALVAYAGAYIASCRWLDDLFVNLAHSYNLWHHGHFSALPHTMVNGTVEIVYYLLLTPFAFSHTSLIVANYALGALVGGLHVILAAMLLRGYRIFPRLVSLCAFAISLPLIQTFSGGYGNGLVSLVVFLGAFYLLKNNVRGLYLCCAAAPLLRPDALIYSVALVIADFIAYRRIAVRWWLPTVLAVVAYFTAIRCLFGQWVPTPMALKSETVADLQSSLPNLAMSLADYIGLNPFHSVYALLVIVFFLSPTPEHLLLTKRKAMAWLFAMFPVLVFFRATNVVGANPTLFRYYVGFELALTMVAVCGLAALFEAVETRLASIREFGGNRKLRWLGAAYAAALSVLLLGIACATHTSLKRDDGQAVGIEMSSSGLKMLKTLTFAGRYCDAVLPPKWHIAATEMDTFGYYSGRDIVDLWGYTNPEIAHSARRNPMRLKYNPDVFLDSNVEVFWLRTIDCRDPDPGDRAISDSPAQQMPHVLAHFANLSPVFGQAGNLMDVFQKYDVVRIQHASRMTTVLLVRKDLTPTLQRALLHSGHTLVRSTPFDMVMLQKNCTVPLASPKAVVAVPKPTLRKLRHSPLS